MRNLIERCLAWARFCLTPRGRHRAVPGAHLCTCRTVLVWPWDPPYLPGACEPPTDADAVALVRPYVMVPQQRRAEAA